MAQRLQLDSVTAGYGRIEVLRNLSFSVPEGSVCALLGPNGAGKTTTLSTISGLLEARRGRILLDGRSINRLTTYERASRGIILIPEGRGVFPGLSVHDNLDIAAHAARGVNDDWRREQLAKVLEMFPRLHEREDQRAGTLSGGEQQMLALSRAFLAKPKVLLLDEISMGLAPQVVAQLFDGVRRLRDEGVTILLVEQYLTYALDLADVCYVMAKGRIVFAGEPEELRGSSSLAGYATA
ncbi:MAG: branched-chain amino acid transport system ATP-binding protein [Frankiales bacterium]|jgi:branched-chain amino acid transport system ATP-binding protein|nr:branched-chain amino acid transport system ATP-binding protein [Frankiales bacterium]